MLFRTAVLEPNSSPDGAPPSYTLSLSSEEPVFRYFADGQEGYEVLSHAPGAIDMSRAARGLAILRNHDPETQVGRLRDIALDPVAKKLRGLPQWSRSQAGIETQQDVEDGIQQEVSVGYMVSAYAPDEQMPDGTLLRRATSWAPLEVSMVPIPADVTVGVGRSVDDGALPTGESKPVAQEVRMSEVAAGAGGASPVAETRVADLEALIATGLPDPRMKEFAQGRMAEWIRSKATVDGAKAELYEELAKRYQAGAPGFAPAGPELTPKEFRQFSITRAIRGQLDGSRKGMEFEISAELAKTYGRETAGVFLPWQVQASAFAGVAHSKRANELTVATAAAGGYLKFTDYAGFVDLFRERLVTLAAGTQYIPGLRSDFQWIRKSAGSTGGWQSTELTNQTNSAWTLATVTLQPKIYQDSLIASRKMIEQAEEAFEPLIRNEIAQTHAVAVEKAVLNGTGASGQPTGIAGTSGIGASAVGGTNGLVPAYSHLMALLSDVTSANVPVDNFAYITHPLGMARLAQTQRFTSTDTPLWDTRMGERAVLGFRSFMSGAVPSAQTKGTSTDCYYIYGGDFSQSVLGEFGTMQVVVDPYTLGPAQVKLSSIQMVDVGVLYPAAFSVMKDARP